FELLIKRWVVEYYWVLFKAIYDSVHSEFNNNDSLKLEDNFLNRFAVKQYQNRFNNKLNITWGKRSNVIIKLLNILRIQLKVLLLSLNNGLSLYIDKKKYKVMAETMFGLFNTGGFYLHDDFLVDNDRIKKTDLLLFIKGNTKEGGRIKAYQDVQHSGYAHFDPSHLSISAKTFFARIIQKYILKGIAAFMIILKSEYFFFFSSIYEFFIVFALPYEKIFSNFKVNSELAYNYFSPSHIAESIVCQNYGTKFYLMHWSDHSVQIDSHIFSFLGCDKFLLWGNAHIVGVEGKQSLLCPTGYVFKKFIKEVSDKKNDILSAMNINATNGKIVSFFDESFGEGFKISEEHLVAFWEMILKFASSNKNNTILIKPKIIARYDNLCGEFKNRFLYVKKSLEEKDNVYIINPDKWSFIEVIGVSDIVVSQEMTSSATIALICGKEGLYLDQASYNHPLSYLFKNRLVFDNSDNLLEMIKKITTGIDKPSKSISWNLLRSFDVYDDDRGINLFRDLLAGEEKCCKDSPKKRIGIILQARMSSTRLPGKVILSLEGKPVLQHIIERLKNCKNVDEIILATTTKDIDTELVNIAERANVKVFRGSEEGVLSRYFYAALNNNLDVIVRITSDCPFIDPDIIDDMVAIYKENTGIDYLSNTIKRTFPRGLDVEIFNLYSLISAFKFSAKFYEREHVTPYIYEHPLKFYLEQYSSLEDNSQYRLTLDTQEDLILIRKIYSRIYQVKPNFRLIDVLNIIKNDKELLLINSNVKQKEICA
ncbi:MAG: NTP transferase domain-containing protein, partial [Candidatus Omnitrophica bacterium]|nr:NTP transferase domain-containing protein [Candidatus Omnitrophota bacterium]